MPPTLSSLLPPPDVEYLLAYKLLSDPNPLPRDILLELIGRPSRYGELRRQLKVKHDTRLTRALRYLVEDGLVYQRLDFGGPANSFIYELGPLGRLVIIRLLQTLPAHESARAMERGRLALERVGSEA